MNPPMVENFIIIEPGPDENEGASPEPEHGPAPSGSGSGRLAQLREADSIAASTAETGVNIG